MAGSGFTQFMVSSIKNNSRRKKREQFDKQDIFIRFNKNRTKLQYKKATKEQLTKIRTRLQEQNKIYQRKLIAWSSVISAILFAVTLYYFR